MDLAFTVVAILLSAQVIGFGPLTAIFAGKQSGRRQILRYSLLVSVPLAFGLAWAYSGMVWSLPETIGIVGASLSVHVVFDRYWREER